MRHLLTAVLSLSLGHVASAQNPDAGPLIGAPMAVIVDGVPGMEPQRIYSKKAGFAAVSARAAPLPGQPDFRFGSIFRDGTGPVGPGFRIDALSLGLDLIHVVLSGGVARLTPPPGTWAAVAFSIKSGSAGSTAIGSVLAEEGKPDRAGADLFNYVVGLDLYPEGLAWRELDGREAGISDGSTPTRELSSLDLHLPAYDLDTGITSHLPAQPRLFFSVPTSALSAVPTSWWGSQAPSGAAILMTEWTGASWTTPIVVVTPVQLALVTADDIDALAVQRDMSTFRVVFSTAAAPANLQVMYKDMLAEGEVPPAPVTGAGGVGLVPDAGAGNGNIDAICMWDPTAAQCSPSVIWSYVFGSPTRVGGATAFPTSFVPRTLEASVLRSCQPGAATLQCQMSGWTAAGAVSGLALHLITAGDRDRPFGEWHLHAMFARNPTAEFGDPKVSPVIIPASLLAPATGRCVNLWSVWIGVNDPPVPPFAQSHMVRISL